MVEKDLSNDKPGAASDGGGEAVLEDTPVQTEGATAAVEDGLDEEALSSTHVGHVYEESLTVSAINGIFGSGTNILDAGSYIGGSQATLDRLKLTDATWLTGLVQGRVTVEIRSS